MAANLKFKYNWNTKFRKFIGFIMLNYVTWKKRHWYELIWQAQDLVKMQIYLYCLQIIHWVLLADKQFADRLPQCCQLK